MTPTGQPRADIHQRMAVELRWGRCYGASGQAGGVDLPWGKDSSSNNRGWLGQMTDAPHGLCEDSRLYQPTKCGPETRTPCLVDDAVQTGRHLHEPARGQDRRGQRRDRVGSALPPLGGSRQRARMSSSPFITGTEMFVDGGVN
jgi:hypothetical protein